MKKIILASSSPRRKALLEQVGIPFEVVESNVDEKIDVENSPYEWVKAISAKKARAVARLIEEDAVIIGADTIITDLGKILEKPKDRRDACHMLHSLQGKTHTVYTGLTVINKDNGDVVESNYVAATDVTMRSLSDQEIETYVNTAEPFDKAGGYAIQGKGSILVESIHGDYYTVVGLPLTLLYTALKEFGIHIMDYWHS